MTKLRDIPGLFLHPVATLKHYQRASLRPDVIAGATVAVILIPQAIAYALIADLPPQVGLYSAIVAAIVGALWGSSNHLQTGPTNAQSLLVFSVLLSSSASNPSEWVLYGAVLAILVGLIRLLMGIARLGMLVNFVSDSVIVGFTAGAGILISIKQIPSLLGVSVSGTSAVETSRDLATHISEVHLFTLAIGLGSIVAILLFKRINPKIPGALISMIGAGALVALLNLEPFGVATLGELPKGFPPLVVPPILNFELIGELFTGAIAIAAIGLIEAISIGRSIANQSGQRLDSNQELVGQGLANIATGLFSGYPVSGSFTRSAVNYDSGGMTPLASASSGVMVLIALLLFAQPAGYIPRAALSGVLIVTSIGMIDRTEILRILRGTRGDAIIMLITFFGTILLNIEMAVLFGIFMSFAVYILRTSTPRVRPVTPDAEFKHFLHQPEKSACPQLAIIDILGDLYFGAATHVEQAVQRYQAEHPEQRFLLLRMEHVNQCDISGIHALEHIVHLYRDSGGDVFLTKVHKPIRQFMHSTNFDSLLGEENFIEGDSVISHLFYRVLDPAICIYECDVRVFLECQNLPKQFEGIYREIRTEVPGDGIPVVTPDELWKLMHSPVIPQIIDVREKREYYLGHIPGAMSFPLSQLFSGENDLPTGQKLVFVCRGGRRSLRAAHHAQKAGYQNTAVLQGGMLAWEREGLLEAVDYLTKNKGVL